MHQSWYCGKIESKCKKVFLHTYDISMQLLIIWQSMIIRIQSNEFSSRLLYIIFIKLGEKIKFVMLEKVMLKRFEWKLLNSFGH